MSAEWRTATLGEVCDFIGRGVSPKYTDIDGVVVLNQRCIRDHRINLSVSRRHDPATKKIADQRYVREGDVLVNSTGVGTLGRVAEVREKLSEPATVDSHVSICRPLDGLFVPGFFGYAMMSIEEEIKNAGEGVGGQTELSRNTLRNFQIRYPRSLAEQERIVRILDEALDAIDTAQANTLANMADADAIFSKELRSAFSHSDAQLARSTAHPSPSNQPSRQPPKSAKGRAATTRHIPGPLSLAVGHAETATRPGWRWVELASIAALESGHTPSRRHPEYWGGEIPWIGIQDARENTGSWIDDTAQHVTELGIENSSARLLPAGTVCMSRTASLGYLVIMSRSMATSQDFVNWVCTDELEPEFLLFLLMAEGRDGLRRYSSGAVHQTIYYPEVKAFHVCIPPVAEQRRLVTKFHTLRDECNDLQATQSAKLAQLASLRRSILNHAFAGEL